MLASNYSALKPLICKEIFHMKFAFEWKNIKSVWLSYLSYKCKTVTINSDSALGEFIVSLWISEQVNLPELELGYFFVFLIAYVNLGVRVLRKKCEGSVKFTDDSPPIIILLYS